MNSQANSGLSSRVTVAITVAILALIISVWSAFKGQPNTPEGVPATTTTTVPGLLQRIESTGKIQAGYGVYPPYTVEDPNTHAVSGYSVEILEQIGKELNAEIVWHRFNWTTMAADLKRGQFDVIVDPIFQTIPRAREFAFTEPYILFADGIAVVRKDDNRFTGFDSLDEPGVTIAVGQGWASETLVRSRFIKAKVNSVQTGTDLLQVFNEVVSGRADVAVADGADAERFVKEHSDKVKALWLDNPPAFMPAGFALRYSDQEGAEFLTIALRNLRSTKVLESLARRYGIATYEK